MTNFGAGIETLGLTMSEVIIQAISNVGVQTRIQQEIETAKKEGRLSTLLKWAEVSQELPYLQACIDEAMRLHNAAGVPLQRVVPPQGVTIEGMFIPGGVGIFSLRRLTLSDFLDYYRDQSLGSWAR